MPTPVETSILANIQTTLEGITVANGYKTTVAKVENVIRDFSDVGNSDKPWLGYIKRPKEFEHRPCNVIRVKLPILIGGHVYSTTKALAQAAVEDLKDDILAAMLSDMTRGGESGVIQTTIKRDSDDCGDPDAVDHEGWGGTFEMEFEILYDRTKDLAS